MTLVSGEDWSQNRSGFQVRGCHQISGICVTGGIRYRMLRVGPCLETQVVR